MIQKGLAAGFREDYAEEVAFARSLGFSFFQLWFHNGALGAYTLPEPREHAVKAAGFPVILHAVFDMPDYEKYGERLLDLLDFFGHGEVIIHPVCKSEPITGGTVFALAQKLQSIHEALQKRGVRLYVENNSVIDGFFHTVDELRVVFDQNPDIGLLLDLAHMKDYSHLRDIVSMRYPACIHIADKHFGIPHEHLPLGDGELDFAMIFKDILTGYDGRVILEAVDTREAVLQSKKVMDALWTPSEMC